MHDLLITGGFVVTMDPARRVIENGAVAITGNRITLTIKGREKEVKNDVSA
jgi:glycerol-3-phosphate responsive antiterminator